MTQQTPHRDAFTAINARVVDEFRSNGGKVGGQFDGIPLLLLSTTGIKSGQPRLSPLAYLTIDGKTIIIGSFGGADVDPAAVAPGFGDYQSKTDRVIPLFELQRA
jgi:hypothetical protein